MMRYAIISFWVFIGVMLCWQFYSYNASLDREQVEHPKQQQFFFYNTNTNTNPAIPNTPRVAGADLRQVLYTVEINKPSTGQFTCHVTIKNVGNGPAKDVQVWVRPYRGTFVGDEDNGHSYNSGPLSDADPAAQFGEWLHFPDLGPGESASRDITFFGRGDLRPGNNPNPQILFSKDKPASH
jgi:hypothetical protein